ncbi:DDE-type integrase/transposase/recombinase [Burkholderia cepacia]|uniref:DDE-type integrase/transposase/recombinase n=1 Tax=Burkholderia cepacia TaxID=292 RepID=UPI003AF36244
MGSFLQVADTQAYCSRAVPAATQQGVATEDAERRRSDFELQPLSADFMSLYPRVMVTDKLRSYAAANNELGLNVEHRQHKGLNNRAENSHQPTRVREKVMRRFKSARQLQRFASAHGQVSNLFMGCRYSRNAQGKREARAQAFAAWERAACVRMPA